MFRSGTKLFMIAVLFSTTFLTSKNYAADQDALNKFRAAAKTAGVPPKPLPKPLPEDHRNRQPEPVMGPQQPLTGGKVERAQKLEWLKEGADAETLQNMADRSKARYYVALGGTVKKYSDRMVVVLSSLPPVGAVASAAMATPDAQSLMVSLVDYIGSAIAKGIRVYGRYKASSVLQVMSSHEQIIEAAQRSYENIQRLEGKIDGLLGFKKKDLKLTDPKDIDLQKLRKNLSNLADKVYWTDYKAKRGAILEQLLQELKKEKENFNQYVTTLKIKSLENELMILHKIQHKDEYIKSIDANIKTIDFSIKQTEIELKAVPGKLSATKDKEEIKRLTEEKAVYDEALPQLKVQLAALETEKTHYKDMPKNDAEINSTREKIKEEIAMLENSMSGDAFDKADFEKLVERVKQLEEKLQSIKHPEEKTQPSS